MTEQELRVLVRQAIARHAADPRTVAPSHVALPHVVDHASHAMFAMPDGADAEGPCIIEPAVLCTHCGYCKSMGH
jgi:hypothetical protein